MNDFYISKITGGYIPHDIYELHQRVWTLFTENEKRNFLFRKISDRLRGSNILVYSTTPPVKCDGWRVETKTVRTAFENGTRLGFNMMINPVITTSDTGKRIDIVKWVKQTCENGDDRRNAVSIGAAEWMARRKNISGFDVTAFRVINYQHGVQVKKKNGREMTLSYMEIDGKLIVTDREKFEHVLKNGLGKNRAFGCGMILLKK